MIDDTMVDNLVLKKNYKKHRVVIQIFCLFIIFLTIGWVWHYSNHEATELKLYALQAIAEIVVALFETIATFLMIKSIKQNGDANREMKKMNEKLQISMQAQTNALKQQQLFYAMQLKEKQLEIKKLEKVKVFNRYLSYVKNFLFAYNRGENFDGIDTKQLFKLKRKNQEMIRFRDKKQAMLMEILKIKLTPNTDLENYIFYTDEKIEQNGKLKEGRIIFTGNDKDVTKRFDCLLREYKYKLRTRLPVILEKYFVDFEENEELQEICG